MPARDLCHAALSPQNSKIASYIAELCFHSHVTAMIENFSERDMQHALVLKLSEGKKCQKMVSVSSEQVFFIISSNHLMYLGGYGVFKKFRV